VGALCSALHPVAVLPPLCSWRLSLGLAGAPSVVLLAGAILLPESPNYLIEK
jgi:hypothetical protein